MSAALWLLKGLEKTSHPICCGCQRGSMQEPASGKPENSTLAARAGQELPRSSMGSMEGSRCIPEYGLCAAQVYMPGFSPPSWDL